MIKNKTDTGDCSPSASSPAPCAPGASFQIFGRGSRYAPPENEKSRGFRLIKSKAVTLLQSAFSYQINAQHCMESAVGGMESFGRNVWNQDRRERNARCRVMPYALRAMPYNAPCALIPYQALRSWINKKTNRSSSFYFGGPSRTRT